MHRNTLLTLLGSYDPIAAAPTYELGDLIDHTTFTSQEVFYDDSDGRPICALLLTPSHIDLTTPHPTVIAQHQHAGEYEIGKEEPAGLAGDGSNAFALPLLEAGYVVFCPEHIGFGKRRPSFPDGSLMGGEAGERWLFVEELLRGGTLMGKSLRDLSCAFELLLTLPFVDSQRIGIAGHSMGGLMAFYFSLYERRIKATTSSCGIGPLRLLQQRHLNHTFNMYLPGILNHGDIEDLFTLLAPTPLYLTFGAEDPIFPKEGAHRLCDRAREAYDQRQATDRLLVEVTEDGHCFTAAKQQRSVEFFKRWL